PFSVAEQVGALAAGGVVGDDHVRPLRALGAQVGDAVIAREANGDLDATGRRLVVDKLPVATIRTAVIELAHVVGIGTTGEAHVAAVVADETGIAHRRPRHDVADAAVYVHLLHARIRIARERADRDEHVLVVRWQV